MMLTRKVDNGSAKTHFSNHFVSQRRSNRTVALSRSQKEMWQKKMGERLARGEKTRTRSGAIMNFVIRAASQKSLYKG